MAVTRLNVYAGMAGFYTIRDAAGGGSQPAQRRVRSADGDPGPVVPHGRAVVLSRRRPDDVGARPQSRRLERCRRRLPERRLRGASTFIGNANLVNGVVWPFMEVEPRKYRLRLLNGANARFYDLRLEDAGQNVVPMSSDRHGRGISGRAASIRNNVLLAPADRADVIVDFSSYAVGSELLLKNLGPDGPVRAQRAGRRPTSNTTGQVMKFKIKPLTAPDTSSRRPRCRRSSGSTRRTQSSRATLIAHANAPTNTGGPSCCSTTSCGPTRLPKWCNWATSRSGSFSNSTQDSHPMHLHLGHFQMLERVQPADAGNRFRFREQDQSWEDTITVNPRENVKIIVRFDQFAGRYVWHCHILEHEDHEMMRPFSVLPSLPGDFDYDGDVDAADLTHWKGDAGLNGDSDADGDGDSDGADFLIWQRNVGAPPPFVAAPSRVARCSPPRRSRHLHGDDAPPDGHSEVRRRILLPPTRSAFRRAMEARPFGRPQVTDGNITR